MVNGMKGAGSEERKEGNRKWQWEEEPEAKYIRISYQSEIS